jgi:hypothetical protein
VVDSATTAAPVERCEMCGEQLDARHGHGHVVDVEKRSLACTCRACYLLFTRDGAGRSRYRAIPDGVRHDPERPLSALDWEALDIPVSTVFLFHNSALGRVVACYPSPAGPTECELDLDAWARLTQQYPLLASIAPDVEALYVTRSDTGIEAYAVGVDACYALVGQVRMRWSGLDGGEEVRQTLAAFLADLRQRSQPARASRPARAMGF